jgi:LuxR family maltose regulon positive regulatory protein
MSAVTAPSPSGVLLGTKLEPPAGGRARVDRLRLVDRLVLERPRRLTLLAAPAGWGKTTLLSQWSSDVREQRRFAWFTIDRSDNDAVRFWAYVIEALHSVAAGVGAASQASLRVSGTDATELVLPQLINEVAEVEDEIVLVLEDFHLVDSPEIQEGVTFLLDHLPSTLELVLATRVDPALPLARLRARGELFEVRAAELAFSRDETRGLLSELLDLTLPEEDVGLLVERTEGWAAGLYLAALSLARQDDPRAFVEELAGADRHIVDYLGGEVLHGLDVDVRSFLLETSILDRLTGDLCDAVTGTTGGAHRLAAIERANLFVVPLDGRRHWYRYHHLFGELLRQELASSRPESLPDLHRRAAGWLAANGAVDEAIDHACLAGDYLLAVQLVSEQWRPAFNRGELTTVDSWLDALPEAAVADDPDLCLARAWVAMDRGRPREAERWLAGARSGGSGESAVLHAVLCFKLGKVAHAERVARDAIAVASEDTPLGLAVAHCILGIARYFGGSLPDAAEALEQAVALSLRGQNLLARIYALGYLALVRLEQGDVEASSLHVDAAIGLAPGPPLTEHFVLVAALLASGRLHRDEETLEHALALARRGAAAVEVGAVELALGELRRDPATLRAARETVASCEEPGRLPELIEAAERRLRGRQRGPRRENAGDLSDRELAVLRLMPSDSSLREIAAALYLSQNTVKTHTRSIYRKLGASSRDEAVARGRDLGLL